VDVVHRGADAGRADRREPVRRVADEKDGSGGILRRAQRGRRPRVRGQHLYIEVEQTEHVAHDPGRDRRRLIDDRAADYPPVVAMRPDQRGARVGEEIDATRPLADDGRQIGSERDHLLVAEVGVAIHRDPELITDAAAGAVGRDDVARLDLSTVTRGEVGHVRHGGRVDHVKPIQPHAGLDRGDGVRAGMLSQHDSKTSCDSASPSQGLTSSLLAAVIAASRTGSAASDGRHCAPGVIGSSTRRMPGSTPQTRRISTARECTPRARGNVDAAVRRSISSECTPWRDSRSDAVRPAGPPPTIKTGTSVVRAAITGSSR
jgi:hypothetical protein